MSKMPTALLRAIDAAIDASTTLDPYEITDTVVDSLHESELRAYLRSALVDRVKDAMRLRRNTSIQNLSHGPVVTHSSRSKSPSRRIAARRSLWQNTLTQAMACENGYKPLADCSVDDLRFVIRRDRKSANATLVLADKYERLSLEMMRLNCKIVSELPEEVAVAALT